MATAKCPVCTDLCRPANHRLGSKGCAPPPSARAKEAGRTSGTRTGIPLVRRRIRLLGGHGNGITFIAVTILQTNLNHSAWAQDTFVYSLVELGVGLAVASEPYRISYHPDWAGKRWSPWRSWAM